jgi:hypothetical protein
MKVVYALARLLGCLGLQRVVSECGSIGELLVKNGL